MVTMLTRLLAVAVAALLPVLAVADKKIDDAVAKAAGHIAKGMPEEAFKIADKLAKDAANPASLLGASEILMRAGKLDESLAAARKAVEAAAAAAPEMRATALTRVAALELRVGTVKDALAHAEEAAKLAPQNAEAVATLVRAQARAKSPAALETADKLVQDSPTSAAAHDARGRALTALGKYEDAEAAFAKAIELDPKLYRAYLHRAMNFVEAGKGAEAEAAARKAIEIDPNQGEGFAALGAGLILKNPKDFGPAIAEAQQGKFLAPSSPFALYWVGRIFEAGGNLAEAASAYQGALKTDPGFVQVQVALVQAQVRRGEVDAALPEAKRLAEENPGDGDAQLLVARVLVSKGDQASLAASLEPLERATAVLPNNAEAFAMLGQAYQANRQFDDAAKAAKRAVELAPNNIDYRTRYGWYLGQNKQYDLGVAELKKVMATPGYKDVAGPLFLGWIYVNMDPPKMTEGMLEYKRVLERDPKNAYAAFELGKAQALAKQCGEAATTLDRAAQLDAKTRGQGYYWLAVCHTYAAIATNSKDLTAARGELGKAKTALGANNAALTKLEARIKLAEQGTARPVEREDRDRDEPALPDLGTLVAQGNGGNVGAIRACAAHKDACVPYLTDWLRTSGNLSVKTAAAKGLGAVGGAARGACALLQSVIASSQERVLLPVDTGKKISSEEAVKQLMREKELQGAAREAMSKIGCR